MSEASMFVSDIIWCPKFGNLLYMYMYVHILLQFCDLLAYILLDMSAEAPLAPYASVCVMHSAANHVARDDH